MQQIYVRHKEFYILKFNFNDIVLVYDEMVSRHFWKIAIVTEVLPSRESEIRGAIVRLTKTNTILKCPVNKLFTVKNIYHDTNQADFLWIVLYFFIQCRLKKVVHHEKIILHYIYPCEVIYSVRYNLRSVEHDVLRYIQLNLNKLNLT